MIFLLNKLYSLQNVQFLKHQNLTTGIQFLTMVQCHSKLIYVQSWGARTCSHYLLTCSYLLITFMVIILDMQLMACLIPMLTLLMAADVLHRLGADCGIKYFITRTFRQREALILSELASLWIFSAIFSNMAPWRLWQDWKLTDKIVIHLSALTNILHSIFGFSQVGFFLLASPFCWCYPGISLSLLSRGKIVFFFWEVGDVLGQGCGGWWGRDHVWQ